MVFALGGVVLLALFIVLMGTLRERFAPTATILAPPYSDAEAIRIFSMLPQADQDTLVGKARESNATNEQLEAARLVTPVVESFFTTVFQPATAPITDETIDTFLSSRTSEIKPIEKKILQSYFIAQSGTGTSIATGQSAGGTTGGSSTSSAAPNAGGAMGQQVFGPRYTSVGSPIDGLSDGNGVVGAYPELLGGRGDTTSVRGPGGIQGPSQNWLLSQSGALPSTASLGSGANSGYLPYSRVPGDQDLIPDPYRLSRNYSTASYSSKMDPVPFLTDFSAFQK